ncbi:MAG: hypothetical protein KIT54_08060 [Phycisphaeraceae bacterium]|nr:hypothetical protein [Phycisphaeraceae bacterium]
MMKPISVSMLLLAATQSLAQCPDYRHDDGSGGFTIGPSEFDATITWGNYYHAEPGCNWLTRVSVSFAGSLPAGTPITIAVYDDPDGDGDPANATLVSMASHASMFTSTGSFASYDIRPTRVGGPDGTGGFFVAVAAFAPQRQSVARMDQDTPGVLSWLYFSDGLLADLGAAPFSVRMIDSPFRGTWMVRAQAQAQGCAVDLDGDGQATLFDFLEFQNAFISGDLLADFDGDLTLTLFDFLAFQSAFAGGCS